MKIDYEPQERHSGVASFLSWSSPDFQNAIRAAFGQSSREEIVRLCIDRNGILAYFEPKAAAVRKES